MNKKKTTRVLALISIMVLMTIISGCGTDEALQVYDDARAKMQKAADMEYSFKEEDSCPDENGKMTSGSMKLESAVVFSGEDFEAKSVLDNQTIYVKDDVEYVHVDKGRNRGKGIRLPLQGEDKDVTLKMLERLIAVDMAKGIELQSDHIKKADMTENKDYTSCEFTIKEEYIEEYLKKLFTEYILTDDSPTLLVFITTGEITDGDLTIKADIDKDGYIKAENFKCKVNHKANQSAAVDIEVNASVRIKSVDTGIKIDFPNFKDYGDSLF